MPLSQDTRNKLMGHLGGKSAMTLTSNLYVGFSSTLPTDLATGITEPVAMGYAREIWTPAQQTVAASGAFSNNVALVFDAATDNWLGGVNLPYITVWRSLAGTAAADFVGWCTATVSMPVLNANIARIEVGAIILQNT